MTFDEIIIHTLTKTLDFPMTLTTSPTYDPGSWSNISSSLSILTVHGQSKYKFNLY